MPTTPDAESILRPVLDEWKSAVDAHAPHRAASYFTEDAISQGGQKLLARTCRAAGPRRCRNRPTPPPAVDRKPSSDGGPT